VTVGDKNSDQPGALAMTVVLTESARIPSYRLPENR
jgi:hypothetical protein